MNRCMLGVALSATAVLAIACADKTVAPSVALSPRFTLRVATTAALTADAQKLWVGAVYFAAPKPGQPVDDTVYFLANTTVPVTGAPQDIDLKVDLTNCLADPTRRGSRTACTMYVAALLEPSAFDPDTSEYFGASYDFKIIGPFDAAPGHVPAVAPLDLSVSHFAVNHWEADEALRLGGALTPQNFTGPISGAVSGSGPATLFALTQGQVPAGGKNPDSTFYGDILAVYQNGSWRRVNGRPGNLSFVPFFTDVAAFTPSDAYVAAADGVGLYHYDGASLSAVSGIQHGLKSVAVSSATPSGRFVIGGSINTGGVWVGDGTTFTTYTLPSLTAVELVCINSGTEAFAASRANGSSVYRFDGTAWTSVPTPSTNGKSDLQCLGPGQAYIAAGGTFYRWNGSGWTALVGPSAPGRGLNWGVVSPNEMYAVGDSANTNRAFYRFDGTTWREVGRLAFALGFNKVWADPRGGAAYVAPMSVNTVARIDLVTPSSASVLTYGASPRDVAMPTATSAFVAGANFLLARWNGSRWNVDAPPAGTRTNRTLNGVWAGDAANAWTVGQQSTIVHWDGAGWTVLSDSTRPIALPSDNYNAAWGAGGSTWIVGDASIVRCTSTSSCATDAQPGGGALYGLWGTSATNIYAVGAGGRILHFDGTAWSSMTSPTRAKLSRVTGSSANDLWAAGDTVLLHFDGSAWKSATSAIDGGTVFAGYQSPVNFQTALWAASAGEVYYGTWFGRILRGGGPNWGENPATYSGPIGFLAIAGAPGACALAVADPNRATTNGSPSLLRGVGPAGCLAAAMTPPASWP
jgi:hypothetical protein